MDAAGYGVDFLRLAELPFTSERKMMTVAADVGGERLSFTKGAPDVLIHRCTHKRVKLVARHNFGLVARNIQLFSNRKRGSHVVARNHYG